MQKLSPEQKKFLLDAARTYRESLPGSPGESHLRTRGLWTKGIEKFGLGYVGEPAKGHERFGGMLCIPYVKDKDLIVHMKFRCIAPGCEHRGHSKYDGLSGGNHLFNTMSLQRDPELVVVTEGEMDAVAADVAGVPSVGVPGANSWRPWYSLLFRGVPEVIVAGDADEAGRSFAKVVTNSVKHARSVELPDGQDINSVVQNNGNLKEVLGIV